MELNEFVDKYNYNIEFNVEENIYIARCVEMASLAAHGDTPEKAFAEIRLVVAAALEWMKEEGEELPRPHQ